MKYIFEELIILTKNSDDYLSSNMEDYMEVIAILTATNKIVRVKDIAKKLSIKMPSVTAALNKLKEKNLIKYEKYGFIELTEKGKETAENIYQKHACLSKFFQLILKIDNTKAEEEACKVEHSLSSETCNQIQKLIEFYENEKKNKNDWTSRLNKELN
jgi:DtxR family Mn-dependent transcriptional regulator